ncbi:outer membrane protein [Methylocapsa sp. S129]|uniref:outer membrane protein n=1 Tax=Methylocapsa sp. S129 TaxID=1641869 RepID=UPI001AEF1779|nr:outer membrane beta-barrel protein [Methylocapsa sp. S129]
MSGMIVRLGLAVAVFVGVAWSHEAKADGPAVAPAPNAPMLALAAPYNWSGFYIGANVGGSWGRSSSNVVFDKASHSGVIETPIGSASQAMGGVLGGYQGGYNFQANGMVFGLEGDFQATSQQRDAVLSDTAVIPHICIAPCAPPPPTLTTGTLDYARSLPWFATLRGRVGVTPTDRWLVYATGGLSLGEIRTDANFALPAGSVCVAPCTSGESGAGAFNQIKAGWALGGGVETALGGGWTGKLEYLHVDFGRVSNSFAVRTGPFDGTFRASGRVADDIVRVGVNYSWGGPVGGKY